MTFRVVRLWWTRTLSITTWKNSGVTSANIWMKSDTTSTSRNIFRYLITAGTNQRKSNFDRSPRTDALEAVRSKRPP